MASSDIHGDQVFHGNVSFLQNFYPPAGAINNSHVSSDANNRIAAAKLIHRIDLHYSQADGADVVAATVLLRICRGIATLLGVELRPTTVPAGGDKAYTVDVLKASDGSSSWTSLLTGVITISSADAADTKQAGTLIGTPTTAAGDAIRVVVATSGSTGSQGQGFVLTIYLEEQPS
jgi:hypothetical protein